jgi:hypothetical protein
MLLWWLRLWRGRGGRREESVEAVGVWILLLLLLLLARAKLLRHFELMQLKQRCGIVGGGAGRVRIARREKWKSWAGGRGAAFERRQAAHEGEGINSHQVTRARLHYDLLEGRKLGLGLFGSLRPQGLLKGGERGLRRNQRRGNHGGCP